jgi:tetratricopeptide (TPR) repeat protein
MNREQRRVGKKLGSHAMPKAFPDTQKMFADAMQHHQAGRLNDAERLYRQVLSVAPRHADSLHLLGVIAQLRGRDPVAIDLIGRAIAINAQVGYFHSNLGNSLRELRQLDAAVAAFREALRLQPHCLEAHVGLGNALLDGGKLDEAAASYKRAIALKSNLPEAHNNLGNVLKELGQIDEAAACYRRAVELKPNYPEARLNLGSALITLGQLDEAVASSLRALALKPDYAEALLNLGNAFRGQGQLDEASLCFHKAFNIKPDYVEACNNLGNVLREQGRRDEAIACCRRAINLQPDCLEAHVTLGSALREQGELDQAVSCFHQALGIKPDYPATHNNLGIALKEQGHLDQAIARYHRAIDLKPDYLEAYNNLGNALRDQGRLGEAIAFYRQAIDLEPDYPDGHNHLAMALLAQGDMAAGWDEYEWRWKTSQMIKSQRHFAQPQWRGEAAEGQTLLIHAEQGFGDTLQFCRYAPLAAARGLRVILEVQQPLVKLLRSLPGVDRVVARGEELPAFDRHCPMLSMPLALRTTVATIPSAARYLRADNAQLAAWQTRLAAIANQGPRIGLVWAGSSRSQSPELAAIDRRRSLAPERLGPLIEVAGLHFFSLQKDGPTAPEDFPLTNFMNEMKDFADTAALIANLDLVISVDTAVAHLAAALGKPVWVLDRFDPCWRWLTGRRDSPWYPTLVLYRQTRPGDWAPVLAEIASNLRGLAEACLQR